MRGGSRILALAAACAILGAQQGLTPAERQANLDSFEKAWKTVLDKHWETRPGGLDWQAVHDELRPRIEAAETAGEARQVVSSMLARLKQSHFGVFPASVYRELDPAAGGAGEANPGIDLRILEGHAVVVAVEPGSSAFARGVKPGWEIVRVNSTEMAPVVQRLQQEFSGSTLLDLRLVRSILARLDGRAGAAVRVDFLDGGGREVSLELERAQPRGKLAKLGNMPPVHFWSEWRKVGAGVGYVRFNMFFEPEALSKTFEEAVNACADCPGFVIDLRGNPGGIAGLAMGSAGWFIDRPGVQLGTTYLRGATIKFVVFPRPQPFRGPLAVLVDGCSASTAEILAGGLKDVKRARVFGTRTAGAALPSIIERLPNGDGFQYAIANYISDGGKPLEGFGVTPDEEVPLTRRGLLEGRDAVLDAALDWIGKQKN